MQRGIARQRGSCKRVKSALNLPISGSHKISHSTLADLGPENHIPSGMEMKFCLILAVAGLYAGTCSTHVLICMQTTSLSHMVPHFEVAELCGIPRLNRYMYYSSRPPHFQRARLLTLILVLINE